MKKSILFVLSFLLMTPSLRAENIGVPAQCEDVMLQAFYWDSYTLTKYGRTQWVYLLKDTTAIRDNFDLVWFPPSAGPSGGGVGYSAKQYSSQDSDWGSKGKLTQLIAALHRGNTKVLADIVINHRGSGSSWCSFYSDNFGSYGSWQLTQKHICRGDECFTTSSSTCYNAAMADRGAADTGDNFSGARDLDHTSEYVQNWAKAYTQWLLNVIGYDGFRYDMTLGYNGRYLSMYNEAAQPYISVSELWSDINTQKNHLNAANKNTMIFDFPLKYQLNGIPEGSYGKLRKSTNSLRGQGLERYAVTFIDNHDTFEREDSQGNEFYKYNADLSNATTKNYILQANAYILLLPGIPCVFWPHWKSYTEEINTLIAIRKQAGIHSESEVREETSSQYNYTATVQGHRGKVIVRLGKKRSKEVPEGFVLAVEGGSAGDYTVFIEEGAQGVEEMDSQKSNVESRKMLKDGQLMIQVGEKVFDVMGRQIN